MTIERVWTATEILDWDESVCRSDEADIAAYLAKCTRLMAAFVVENARPDGHSTDDATVSYGTGGYCWCSIPEAHCGYCMAGPTLARLQAALEEPKP